jgi:multidrug efflux pump subunit AcrA (membrane-fusion protein)
MSKVSTDQKVEVVVDAFPKNKYTGKIVSIANVGEQLPNSDAKMFETIIKLDGSDPQLRTAMTTGNKIIVKTIDDVVYIPTECVQASTDSIPFVYLKNKTRRIVMLGESNEKNVIVRQGLEPGANLYLITPEDAENFRLTGEELIPAIKSQARMAKN